MKLFFNVLLIFFVVTSIEAQSIKEEIKKSKVRVVRLKDSITEISKREKHLKYYLNQLKQLEQDSELLNELVLSVSKDKENISRVAEQMKIVDSKAINKIVPQSTADIFNQTPGMFVQKSQLGGGSPVLRGMEANRVLLVVDGVRLNNAIYRKGHLQNSLSISPFSLDRVEVIFGPSSMVYGSDALGGVIHYYTKMLSFKNRSRWRSNIFSSFNSVNNATTFQTDFSLESKKWTYYSFASRADFGDLRMGKNRSHGYENWGKVSRYFEDPNHYYFEQSSVNRNTHIQKNTGYNQLDIIQKLGYKFNSKINALLNIQYSKTSTVPRFDRMQEYENEDLKFIEWRYGPQKRFLTSAVLKMSNLNSWMDYGSLTFAYQNIEESRIRRKLSDPLTRNNQTEQVHVYSVNGDFYVNLAKKQKRKLHYGFEWVGNNVFSKAVDETFSYNTTNNLLQNVVSQSEGVSRYPSDYSNYFSKAIYLNYRQSLDFKNTLNTGLRYSHIHLSSRWLSGPSNPFMAAPVEVNNSALTASFSLIHKPKAYNKWGLVLSSGFRSPNVDDIGKVREKNGYLTVPNTNLKPEYAYNSEINFTYNKPKKIGYTFNAYYTLLDNYISRSEWNGDLGEDITSGYNTYYLQTNVNNGKAYISGSTFQFWTPSYNSLRIDGFLSYTTGYSLDKNEPLSSIPPLNGNLKLFLEKKRYQVYLNYQFNAAKNPNKYNITEGIDNIEESPLVDQSALSLIEKYAGTPFWAIWNIQTDIQLSKKINLQLGIENIMDKHYKVFASAINAPGRNFKASLRYAIN